MPVHGIKAVYQPFSLQERMAPLAMMKEEYDKINESLAELSMTANQAAQYIDPNSEAGRTLSQYNQILDDAAGTLSREGLKGLSRTALYNLKRTYQSQIAPITEGAKNYFTLQAKIKEMQWKDPTIMVSDMPSLDEYIKNPNALPNLISGNQLMQEGANAALTLPGVDYDQLSRYLNGDTSAIPDLDTAVQNIADKYGVSTEQAMKYITSGVMSGLGKRATELYDTEQKVKMEEASKLRVLNAQSGKEAYIAKLKHGYTMEEIAARNSGKNSKSGSAYLNQIDGAVYAKGNTESMLKSSAEISEKTASTKARYIGFMNLNKENKVRALRALGANVSDDVADDVLETIIADYADALSSYTYMEYREKEGKNSKNDEFFMIPSKPRRDTSSGNDDNYDDFTLSQGE